jgi:DNA-binding transcriptional LysR family regulator
MDLRRLRLFLLLAEEKNFHRAAERAYLSQPALSQQIQALERELGVRLLERRPFRLTPAGEALAREGKALLQEVEALKERVRRAGRESLRFGVPENLLPDLMPLLDHLRRGLGEAVEGPGDAHPRAGQGPQGGAAGLRPGGPQGWRTPP